ncbi:MAG: WYL domain-containing protein [Bacteroidota bacterium]
MSKNKNQLARFRRIHELLALRKGTVVHPDEFCRACDISRRTLDNDLAYMRDAFDAPIVWDKSRRGYYYERPFDLTAQIALNIEDVHRLHLAVETLAQFEHLEGFKGLRGTVEKIRQGVSGWVRSSAAAKAIYFEPVPYGGTEHLPVLLRAIEERRRVSFPYQSFRQDTPQTCELDPYLIRQYDQRWYVIGHSPQYDYLKPFALERIAGKPNLHKTFFEIPPGFDPEQVFKHIYGMHPAPPEEAQDVVLRFSVLQARYFLSKPFHPYTLLEENAEGTTVLLRVCINIELLRKIAGLGAEVRVVEPEGLRVELVEFHRRALEGYL